ncbi:MAG: HAMP domain-containing histidine kinase [Burkholderiaceae bacterium]|nr:HAMP domain-containing histidine kinase [Burkholderiaceae bacterium]
MTEPRASILERLSRLLVGVSLLWGIGVAVVVSVVIRHEVDEIMDATLRESSQILHDLLRSHASILPLGDAPVQPAPPHKEELVWQLVGPAGQVLLRSHRAPTAALAPPARHGLSDTEVQGPWRVLVSAFDDQGRVLMVAQTGDERREAKLEAVQYTVGGALLVGLLCAAWLRRRIRRELRPLSELSQAVAHFDPLQPGATLPAPQWRELAPVSEAITHLGARLAARVDHERAFAAHAAHALRTPLAGIMAQLAVAQRISPAQSQPVLRLARQAADRLRSVVGALLALFRSSGELRWQPLRLDELMAQWQVDGLAVTVAPPFEVRADPDLLAAALANLVDNALRHGATRLQVGVTQDDRTATLRLQDDGPGVDAARRAALQQALDRQAYAGHTGLGLMLADLVARAHGGRLRLLPSPQGFLAELQLGNPPRREPGSSQPLQARSLLDPPNPSHAHESAPVEPPPPPLPAPPTPAP